MVKRFVCIVLLVAMVLCAKQSLAQDPFTIPNKVVVEGDTLNNFTISKIYVFPWHKSKL